MRDCEAADTGGALCQWAFKPLSVYGVRPVASALKALHSPQVRAV
jgi:hypothetical protein